MSQSLLSQIVATVERVSREFEPTSRAISETVERLNQVVEPYLPVISQAIEGFLLYDLIVSAYESSGWLPHRAVPFKQFLTECERDRDKFIGLVSDYYEIHSQRILQQIRSQIMGYSVDQESKETLLECLQAHERGLYRCVYSTLWPEIERVLREKLLRINPYQGVGEAQIHIRINAFELSDFAVDGPWGLVLFGHLINSAFSKVGKGEGIQGLTTPNRHAVAHKFASYSSCQESLNTIIFSEYIFRLVTYIDQKTLESPSQP